jgi:hypothetical protein
VGSLLLLDIKVLPVVALNEVNRKAAAGRVRQGKELTSASLHRVRDHLSHEHPDVYASFKNICLLV